MRKVSVPLGRRSYEVLVGEELLAATGEHCRRLQLGKRCAIITDANVAPRFAHLVHASLQDAGFEPALVTTVPGEPSKRLAVAEQVCLQLAQHRLDRKSFVIALGGGVTGDLAGFVASIYLRGIAFVQVPTTLLAQVDSSVGGKVGVNLRVGKNLVGAFLQPRLVLCDLNTLLTLPDREFRAGLAEVIKYGIIRDAALFRRLENELDAILDRDPRVMESIVARCCAIKAEVVSKDETEGGLRAILNFGHTIGHALEAITSYGRFLHGEAISIGQVAAALLSTRLSGLPAKDADRIEALFRRAGLPTAVHLSGNQRERLLDAMRLDKKVADGEVRFVLATKIGQVLWGQAVPESAIHDVLDALEKEPVATPVRNRRRTAQPQRA